MQNITATKGWMPRFLVLMCCPHLEPEFRPFGSTNGHPRTAVCNSVNPEPELQSSPRTARTLAMRRRLTETRSWVLSSRVAERPSTCNASMDGWMGARWVPRSYLLICEDVGPALVRCQASRINNVGAPPPIIPLSKSLQPCPF